VAIGYQTLGKYQIATAWTIEAKIGSEMRVMNFRVGDLQLDGRPISLAADGKPATSPGK
jgi:hypothetical protein